MNKQMKVLFYAMVVVIGILAASTAFFYALYAKSRNGSSTATATKSSSPSAGATLTANQTPTPTPKVSTAVTRAATEKPSHANKTYTVQSNDTLFGIAQKQGTTLADLSEANGITDSNKIQAGQVLFIPENGQVDFLVDATTATSIQGQVDQGKTPWRLAPDETARADAPSAYGLKITDSFSVKDRDDNNGKASVQASSADGNFLITLSQPATKGAKGIWAIVSIKKI